jgi:uncharacterized membrane protein
MKIPQIVRTRGGMLVGLVVIAAIGFEIRTVLGMFFGIDLPATPYLIVMIGILSVIGIILDLSRTSGGDSAGR